MFAATASACAVTMDLLMHSFREHIHKHPVKFPISAFHFSNIFLNSPTSKTSRAPMTVNWSFLPEPPLNKLLNFNQNPFNQKSFASTIPLTQNAKKDQRPRMPFASTIPLAQNNTKDQTPCKLKLLCNFGGKIMPRCRDGNLHYVGGQSRVIAVRRDIKIHEFYRKMKDATGDHVRICYQLPNQSLDTLVSVYTIEDFENMLDETDYLSKAEKASSCGSTKLRVFLFPRFGLEDISDRFDDSNDCGPSHINKTDEVFAYEAKERGEGLINESLEHQHFRVHAKIAEIENLGNQHDTRNMGNQQQLHDANTSDSFSLFSNQDTWRMLGFQLSNIN